MNSIKLIRLDFRLIHGQVITKWNNIVQAKTIIIVNDALVDDPFLADIYEMAAPVGTDVKVLKISDFVERFNSSNLPSGNILLLFKDTKTLRNIIEQGVDLKEVQIGGLGGSSAKLNVMKGISLDKEDVENLKAVYSKCNIYFQVIPEEQKVDFSKILKKIGGN